MPEFSTPTPERARWFAVSVPDYWAKFDVANLRLAQARREAMAKAGSAAERLDIDELFRSAQQAARGARRAGALWGAATATAYDDGLFVAQVMMFGVRVPPDDVTATSLTDLMGRARTARKGRDPLPDRRVATVELADGTRASRIEGLEDVQLTDRDVARVIVSHTVIPIPGGLDDHFVLTGLSPNLQQQGDVLDLFDAIAGTFRFVEDDRNPPPPV